MATFLSGLFEEAQAPCVEWEGGPLYAIYEMSASPRVSIDFLRSRPSPVQGLRLKLTNGFLWANGVESPELTLWADTAPRRVVVDVHARGGETKLKIWNVWRGQVGGKDVAQAWLGNSGMRVDAVGETLSVACSNGEGPVDFDDLKVEITLTA